MTASPSTATTDYLAAARELGPLIRAHADRIEADRCLPPALMAALIDAGLFRMFVPASLGGGETDPETFLEVIEEISQADGSVGWLLANAAPHGATVALLQEEVAREIFGRDPGVMISLTLAPPGRAIVVEGGYRVTARWRFASGCRHATWHSGLCALFDGETPLLRADGTPEQRFMLAPVAELTILDTWQVTGMRGTGSHDVAVTDLFVAASHSYTFESTDHQRYPGALYNIWFDLGPPFISTVALGMARAAIDAFIDLARIKRRQYTSVLLSEHAAVQALVGRAEAHLRAAHAFLWETMRSVWDTAGDSGGLSDEQRTLLRLAAAHAMASAVQVMDMLWDAAGATAIFTSSPLERIFRNIHTMQHNIFLGSHNYETAGGTFLRGRSPEI